MVQIEFYDVLFYDMKQKYFVSDMKQSVVMDIYFFIYNALGGETFMFYIKSSKKSKKIFSSKCVLYKKINIHNNEIFHVRFAIMQKNTEETCKNVR